MALQEKTLRLIEAAREELEAYHPMTLRQVFYRLVSRQLVDNDDSGYDRVLYALKAARKTGMIPWDWIEDRLRRPRQVNMWDDLADFAETAAKAYRRDVWATQPSYLEVWLEKDALSRVFGLALEPYGVTLNVGRGYDGWTSIYEASYRLDDDTTILYFGDFDPSGVDMVRSLGGRLAFFGCHPNIVTVAMTLEDRQAHPEAIVPVKPSDSRARNFIDKFGDTAIELDALPPPVLSERLETALRDRLDLDAMAEVWEQEQQDRNQLRNLLTDIDS